MNLTPPGTPQNGNHAVFVLLWVAFDEVFQSNAMHFQGRSIRKPIGIVVEQASPASPSRLPSVPALTLPQLLSPLTLDPCPFLPGGLLSIIWISACMSPLIDYTACFPMATVCFALFHFLHGAHCSLTLPCLFFFFLCLLSVSKVHCCVPRSWWCTLHTAGSCISLPLCCDKWWFNTTQICYLTVQRWLSG